MDAVTFPIRVFKQLGVDTVVCKYAKDRACVATLYKGLISDWQ